MTQLALVDEGRYSAYNVNLCTQYNALRHYAYYNIVTISDSYY